MLSSPATQSFLVERVVTGGDGVDLCGLNGLHGDGAEFSFGCGVAEYQIGYEFREFSLLRWSLLLWSYRGSLLYWLLSVWLCIQQKWLTNKIPTV
jgi:hypothetical protein